MTLLAIDPGLINFGWAVLDEATLEVVQGGVISVRKAADGDVATATNILTAMRQLVAHFRPTLTLIENQGQSLTLKGIQQATITALLSLDVPVRLLYAQTIKVHFRSRGLGFNGNRQNKKDAEQLVRQMGYGNVVNHVADCILMAVYHGETSVPGASSVS